jgi:hypothetical protein
MELLQTGRITFPLPYATEILSIRRGEQTYEAVAETIDRLLADVEIVASLSSLREEPDFAFMDDLVATAYRSKVLSGL